VIGVYGAGGNRVRPGTLSGCEVEYKVASNERGGEVVSCSLPTHVGAVFVRRIGLVRIKPLHKGLLLMSK
jgi:hypothetical protein